MFAIPPLPDLVTRSRRAFRAYLPGTDAWLWPNFLVAAAKVIAGRVSEVFGLADYIARQRFAGTADSENLERHAQEVRLSRRPADFSTGPVRLTSLGAIALNAGAILQRADGVQYAASAGGSLLGPGTLDVAANALVAGAAGNALEDTALAIVSGLTGDATAAVGAGGIVGGLDVEEDGEFWTTDLGTLRGRVLFRKRNPPHGGAPADYVLWATAVTGVTRVFVERDAPEVRVYPLLDDLRSDGLPNVADLAAVESAIEPEHPATAIVTVLSPRARAIDIIVQGLTPDTTDVREAVLSELRATFRRLSKVAGVDIPHPAMPFLAVPSSFSVSWIWQAVANASGEQRHRIVAPASTADIALNAGEIATLGTVTFVS